jgi:hypothetical protein
MGRCSASAKSASLNALTKRKRLEGPYIRNTTFDREWGHDLENLSAGVRIKGGGPYLGGSGKWFRMRPVVEEGRRIPAEDCRIENNIAW